MEPLARCGKGMHSEPVLLPNDYCHWCKRDEEHNKTISLNIAIDALEAIGGKRIIHRKMGIDVDEEPWYERDGFKYEIIAEAALKELGILEEEDG